MLKLISAAAACVLAAAVSAQAATISARPNASGTQILIRGVIMPGDERQFRTVAAATSGDVVVMLNSSGGSVGAAIAIGRTVRSYNFTTLVGRGASCASACPLIWLSGRSAMIQQNSRLGFHAAAVDGQYSPEATALMARHLRMIGLTSEQIEYIVGTKPPKIRWVTEVDALALSIGSHVVPSR
jgi:hypothetical protein